MNPSRALLVGCSLLIPLTGMANTVPEIEAVETSLVRKVKIKGRPDITSSITQRMADYKVPGLSLAIVKDGKLHWAKGYGIANIKTGSQVTTDTLFQAGSISKPVAALAAMKLVEQQKLSLDDSINRYLKGWQISDFENKPSTVTLRQLLTHTGGLTVHGFPGYKPTDTIPTTIEVLAGQGNTAVVEPDMQPQQRWRYSGGGYTVMQLAVESVTEQAFDNYMQDQILSPIGMSYSTYSLSLTTQQEAQASAAYDSQGELIEGVWHRYPEMAAAGLWTTPGDLARYVIHLQEVASGKSKGILSQQTVKDMFTPHQNNWGLGPVLGDVEGKLTFGHGGKNAGFTNDFMAFVDSGEGVIVMANGDNANGLIQEILLSVSGVYGWNSHSRILVSEHKQNTHLQDQFSGRYRFTEDIPGVEDYIVEVSVNGSDMIIVDKVDGSTSHMVSTAELVFTNIESGRKVEFSKSDAGQIESFLWSGRWHFAKLTE